MNYISFFCTFQLIENSDGLEGGVRITLSSPYRRRPNSRCLYYNFNDHAAPGNALKALESQRPLFVSRVSHFGISNSLISNTRFYKYVYKGDFYGEVKTLPSKSRVCLQKTCRINWS